MKRNLQYICAIQGTKYNLLLIIVKIVEKYQKTDNESAKEWSSGNKSLQNWDRIWRTKNILNITITGQYKN